MEHMVAEAGTKSCLAGTDSGPLVHMTGETNLERESSEAAGEMSFWSIRSPRLVRVEITFTLAFSLSVTRILKGLRILNELSLLSKYPPSVCIHTRCFQRARHPADMFKRWPKLRLESHVDIYPNTNARQQIFPCWRSWTRSLQTRKTVRRCVGQRGAPERRIAGECVDGPPGLEIMEQAPGLAKILPCERVRVILEQKHTLRQCIHQGCLQQCFDTQNTFEEKV